MRRSNAVDSNQAVSQWHHLMQVLEQDAGAVLERMKPVPDYPIWYSRRTPVSSLDAERYEPFSLCGTAEGRGVF